MEASSRADRESGRVSLGAGALRWSRWRWSALWAVVMATRLMQDVDLVEETELRRLEGYVAAASGAVRVEARPADLSLVARARASAVATEVYDAQLPIAIVGMDIVQGGMPVQYDPRVKTATVVQTLVAAPQETRAVVCAGHVQTSLAGPARSVSKDRQLIKLAEKWRCAFCRTFNNRDGVTLCGTCGAAKPSIGAASEVSARELERYESRRKSAVGRRLNSAGSGQAAGVQRQAAGEVFDSVKKAQLVRLEIGELETAIGGVHYLEDQESNMSVIEGFLVVHYLGKLSIIPDAGKAAGLDPPRGT